MARNPIDSWLTKAKCRAKAKGVPFDLTRDDVPPIPRNCPCCGRALVKHKGKAGPDSPSIDRKIPARGYVRGNVQWICRRCNTIKNDATPEEIMRVAIFAASSLEAAS